LHQNNFNSPGKDLKPTITESY